MHFTFVFVFAHFGSEMMRGECETGYFIGAALLLLV